MIKFSCSVCHESFDVDDACGGMEVNCTKCGAVISVPRSRAELQGDDRMCIKFRCANCGHNLKLEPQYAGKRVLCAGCHQPLVVPTSNGFRWAWFRKAKPISKEMDYSV